MLTQPTRAIGGTARHHRVWRFLKSQAPFSRRATGAQVQRARIRVCRIGMRIAADIRFAHDHNASEVAVPQSRPQTSIRSVVLTGAACGYVDGFGKLALSRNCGSQLSQARSSANCDRRTRANIPRTSAFGSSHVRAFEYVARVQSRIRRRQSPAQERQIPSSYRREEASLKCMPSK